MVLVILPSWRKLATRLQRVQAYVSLAGNISPRLAIVFVLSLIPLLLLRRWLVSLPVVPAP